VPIGTYVPRLLSPGLRKRDPSPPWRAVALIGWTGMRGIVSLALALAIPVTLADGSPFAQRDLIIVLSFAVIMVTLVLQALTLPRIIRWLGFEDEGIALKEEREALISASEAAVARLQELDNKIIVHPLLMERVRSPYEERLTRLTTEAVEDPECKLTEGEAQAFRKLRNEALAAERQAVVKLRNQGKISEEVLHKVQEALDLEALQPDR
jgi:NhaP-type Na+/H+ or K+/H+ antiporter